MNAPKAARVAARLAADAAADNLAHDAGVDELADGAALGAGAAFPDALMAHELVLNHRLAMRFGAMADEFIDFTKPSVDPGERQVGRDSVQYAAIAARMSERVRQAALAFRRVKAGAAGRGKPAKPLTLCAGCKKKQDRSAGPLVATRPSPRELARAELAEIAGLAELADGAALACGDDLPAILMAHELALNHRLVMRFGAMAGRFLGYVSATIDADRRQVGRDSLKFAVIAARLGERVGGTARALAELAAADNRAPDGGRKPYHGPLPQGLGCDNCGLIFDAASGPGGSSLSPASQVAAGGAALRRGRLNNNNPVGDFAKAPRCGARTRALGCCRQPAMRNGRCRLHGGKSTGPRTEQGLATSRAARLRHGRRRAAMIQLRSDAFRHGRRLARLTRLARAMSRGQANEINSPPPVRASRANSGLAGQAGRGGG